MSTQVEFYRARAAEARQAADSATLANVRDRCLRSALAWQDMADRATRTEAGRARSTADKAVAGAAEA